MEKQQIFHLCKTVWVKSSPIDQKGKKWTTIVFIWWIGDYVIWWTYPRNSNKLLGGFEMEWTPKRLLVIDLGQIGLHIGWFQCRCLMPPCRSTAAAAPDSKSSVHNTLQSQDSWILCFFGIMSSQGERSWCAALGKCRNSQVDGFVGPRKKRGDGQNVQKERDT